MEKMNSSWQKFIEFITFINLPIRKKFLLFEMGTFFWFLMVGLLSVASLSFIHYRYSQIEQSTLPYMKFTYTLSPELSSLEHSIIDAKEHHNDAKTLYMTKVSLDGIKSTISDVLVKIQNNPTHGNIFETVIQSLSKDDSESFNLFQEILKEINLMDGMVLEAQKKAVLNASASEQALLWQQLGVHVSHTQEMAQSLSKRVELQYQSYSIQVGDTIRLSINSLAIIIVMALTLLMFFTRWLREAFSKPIESMIHQIHSIGTGEVDLSKKLKIKSKDEIGTLSKEFNKLVDTVYGVTVFKKVIEEDNSLEVVYTRLGEVFEREAGISNYRIFDVNAAKSTMNVVYPHVFDEKEFMACNEEILHDCTLCRAQKTGHKVSSFEFDGVCKEFMNDAGKKHVCIPLIVAGHAGAVVQFVFNKTHNAEEIERVNEQIFKAESYIKNSLSVIETKRLMNTLRESSLVDGLTGLYNRRFLQDHSNQIIASTLRRKKQISLLMCDMDYFKQVNDKFGHDVGDSVLKDTSHILKKCVRDADIVIRFGGEEFLILLIDSEVGNGMAVAEKIRLAVEEYNFKTNEGVLKKTISMGISDFPNDADGFWQVIKFADVALYKAKENGRNRCVQFSNDLWDQKANF
ncbi:MAG: GGDEF domain-containing protein [Sulfurospirillaceae bacterium]|nr:GGDEF domain-containing protein [Sulfurospirillaceae bacterium]MDD2826556.1 GGDEF domain-containing protein [Sulfurospirillaceae bacterium]